MLCAAIILADTLMIYGLIYHSLHFYYYLRSLL